MWPFRQPEEKKKTLTNALIVLIYLLYVNYSIRIVDVVGVWHNSVLATVCNQIQ